MTSFWGAKAKLGAGVNNELGGSAPHQCRSEVKIAFIIARKETM